MEIISNINNRSKYRYAVYQKHSIIGNGKEIRKYAFIVLKNEYDVIVHFTNFHRYTGSFTGMVCRPVTSNNIGKMKYICQMLNYVLINKYDILRVNHVFEITKPMLISFFTDYAAEMLPNDRHKDGQSVKRCIAAVLGFIKNLCKQFKGYMSVSDDELFDITTVTISNRRKKLLKKPSFQIEVYTECRNIFRDIPSDVMNIIIERAFSCTEYIAFGICLQAFAGLRPGEVCSMYREYSPLGKGISFTEVDGRIVKAEIDLTHEYNLRSDMVICGKIKKKRIQRVYPAFLDAFSTAYSNHLEFLAAQKCEKEYLPMFVENSGMAMTYEYYAYRFQHLMLNFVRPELLKIANPECRLFGQLLFEKKLGLHSLRHWFTVQLVLHGEDIAQVQYWRGDSSPESALTYLMNKGELVKQLSEVNNKFAEIFMEANQNEK